jgi:hypothetical protein
VTRKSGAKTRRTPKADAKPRRRLPSFRTKCFGVRCVLASLLTKPGRNNPVGPWKLLRSDMCLRNYQRLADREVFWIANILFVRFKDGFPTFRRFIKLS